MELPHLRKTVTIKFSSLRNGMGDGFGVIFDIDTVVTREAYRVRVGDDWKWQIKGYNQIFRHDSFVEVDQEILDMHGSELEVEILQIIS